MLSAAKPLPRRSFRDLSPLRAVLVLAKKLAPDLVRGRIQYYRGRPGFPSSLVIPQPANVGEIFPDGVIKPLVGRPELALHKLGQGQVMGIIDLLLSLSGVIMWLN
jgi:hypothetical protein